MSQLPLDAIYLGSPKCKLRELLAVSLLLSALGAASCTWSPTPTLACRPELMLLELVGPDPASTPNVLLIVFDQHMLPPVTAGLKCSY